MPTTMVIFPKLTCHIIPRNLGSLAKAGRPKRIGSLSRFLNLPDHARTVPEDPVNNQLKRNLIQQRSLFLFLPESGEKSPEVCKSNMIELDNEELPVGFMMELARHTDILNRFSDLSKPEQAAVVNGARMVKSRGEMRSYVESIFNPGK